MNAALHEWAQQAVAIPLAYARRGQSLAQAALAGARRFEALRHYPAHDMVDVVHGTRAFYHSHDAAARWGDAADQEHGHFHVFWDGPRPGAHVHLVALALDARGQPLHWFTTNRWVTAGRWLDAAALARRLPSFRLQVNGRLAPLARWLTAMVQLFADELVTLLQARDAALLAAARGRSRRSVWADRSVEVLAHIDAALPARLQRLGLLP
ncbi:DUF6969 family protein [Tepidimonas charontis]|uniref:DUF6969 domain-containing protein n=1 Tax=Tepidimonas charontis TaxID=2267262 RepID=A0A554XIU5_9BURK|nr:hypothetical protein [Tepidimonas charontis]TSE35760.1 hypothetical protein Tchar_00543 [Tepidimonas charontis]